MIQSPWAILLCKFKDDDSEPYERQRYEDLFTSSGAGKLNMVDFFRDMSHGKLDLSGSRVFGWYILDKNRSDYLQDINKPGLTDQEFREALSKGRNELIEWARQAAIAQNVDLTRFFSIVVCMNVPTDLFGGSNGAVCDDGRNALTGMSSMSPSFLGQEMAHVYGLSHSRAEGSTAEYGDQWDVMSTAAAFMAPHTHFVDLNVRGQRTFLMGPGVNAANMWAMGWLDKSRVWETNAGTVDTVVTLRPLHRQDLPGFLAIQFGEYLVEFRIPEEWDAAIPKATVLVHRFDNGNSYLVSDSNGQQTFDVGSVFRAGTEIPGVISAARSINVLEINANEQFARIRLHHHSTRVNYVVPEEQPFRNPGVAWGVIADGNTIRINTRSPLLKVLRHIALYENSETIPSVQLRNNVRLDVLSALVALAQDHIQTLQAYRQPAAPQETQRLSSEASV